MTSPEPPTTFAPSNQDDSRHFHNSGTCPSQEHHHSRISPPPAPNISMPHDDEANNGTSAASDSTSPSPLIHSKSAFISHFPRHLRDNISQLYDAFQNGLGEKLYYRVPSHGMVDAKIRFAGLGVTGRRKKKIMPYYLVEEGTISGHQELLPAGRAADYLLWRQRYHFNRHKKPLKHVDFWLDEEGLLLRMKKVASKGIRYGTEPVPVDLLQQVWPQKSPEQLKERISKFQGIPVSKSQYTEHYREWCNKQDLNDKKLSHNAKENQQPSKKVGLHSGETCAATSPSKHPDDLLLDPCLQGLPLVVHVPAVQDQKPKLEVPSKSHPLCKKRPHPGRTRIVSRKKRKTTT